MSRIPSNLSAMAGAASIPGVRFPSGRHIDPNTIANIALFHLDCVVVENQKKDKKFTLFMDQIDKHIIENPNIFDEESFRDLQNRNIGTEVSFVNEDDPFYRLDEALPIGAQNRVNELRAKKQTANLGLILNDIVLFNSAPNTSRLKQFNLQGLRTTTPKVT
jgi:hypothetical protein|tara:strand:- start:256 stop:741 length:486 start_codon:yes stop_codon:yes gene_type:complete